MAAVLGALAARLALAPGHGHATEHAPVAVLCTDGDRGWEPAMTAQRARRPNFGTLGDDEPAAHRDTAAWIKRRLGSVAAGDPAPVIGPPGPRSLQFRSLEDNPKAKMPIAELPFRGTWRTRQNGNGWTLLAPFTSEKGGLGLCVAEDQATVTTLERLLPHVLDADLGKRMKPSRLEAEHFVILLTDGLEGGELDDPGGARKGCPDHEWTVFRAFVRRRLDVDLDRDGAVVVAAPTRPQRRWAKGPKRFAEAVSDASDADALDLAVTESNRDFALRLADRERRLLRKIQHALERIQQGEYGVCESCGAPITYPRLMARPVATLCIDCKTEMEQLERPRRAFV